jgi:hypothetical protein
MMRNSEQEEQVVSSLVLYDWGGSLDRTAWLSLACEFFRLLGATPNFAEFSAKPNSRKKVKPEGLQKVFQENAIRSCTIDRLLSPFSDVNRSDISCSFSELGGDDRTKVAAFSHFSETVDADLFVTVIQTFSRAARITYGHAYLRPVRLGPTMYAYDLVYGLDRSRPDEAEELERMRRWSQERLDMVAQNKPAPFRHLAGMQRDVYPLNVLTRPHLEREIGGQPLEKWIAADASRGQLQQVADGVWVWVVPEQSLETTRGELAEAELLVTRAPRKAR